MILNKKSGEFVQFFFLCLHFYILCFILYIKHKEECFIRTAKHEKWVEEETSAVFDIASQTNH